MGILRFERAEAGRESRQRRATLLASLLGVAAFYAWYCAPLGTGSANGALAAALAAGAAIFCIRAISTIARLRGLSWRRQAARPSAVR
jgi:hypothetical protein